VVHNVYASPNIVKLIKSRRMRWSALVARMVELRISYKVWSENLKGREHGRRRHRWEDNIRMTVQIVLECVDWIHQAQDREQ
jgi:hypothetical protein